MKHEFQIFPTNVTICFTHIQFNCHIFIQTNKWWISRENRVNCFKDYKALSVVPRLETKPP